MGKQAKTGDDKVDPGKSVRVMNAEAFKKFHKQAVTLKGRADEANTERGDFIAKAAKEKGLNKTAYAFAAKMDKMLSGDRPKPDSVAEAVIGLRRMMEALDIENRCNVQGRLEFDGTGRPSATVKAEPGDDGEPEQSANEAGSDDERDLRPGFLQQGSIDPGPAVGGAAQDRVREIAAQAGAQTASAPTEPQPRGKRRPAGEEPNPDTKH